MQKKVANFFLLKETSKRNATIDIKIVTQIVKNSRQSIFQTT